MKYLKLFESFDGNNFIVDDQTTPQHRERTNFITRSEKILK
jgi:hypothetical protein